MLSMLWATAPARADEEIVLLPTLEVTAAAPSADWRYATCGDFEVLSDQSSGRTRLFAEEMACFLAYIKSVCPELLLPAGTRLSIILAGPRSSPEIIPDFPSPLGLAEKPLGVLARTEDTAVLVVRYPANSSLGLLTDNDLASRTALTVAQATYMNDPALTAHRRVRSNQPSVDTSFTTAVGEGRDFLGPGQTFMKTGLLAVVAGMGNVVGLKYSFHDQKMRWAQYFPFPMVTSRQITRSEFPIKKLPPLENLFAVDPASPVWSSPLHRLTRDSFVYWSLFENSPGQARAFLDLLSKLGTEPMTETLFRQTYGRSFAEVEQTLIEYVNPAAYRDPKGKLLPQQPLNFWSARAASFPQIRDSYQERAASRIEISRITADFLRMVGRPNEAKKKLAARFQKKQLDDNIWITAGLMNLAQQDWASAEASFRAAIAAGSTRPLPYVRLAALRFAALQAQSVPPDAQSLQEYQAVLALLAQAQERAPQLKEIPRLLCEIFAQRPETISPEGLRLLSASAKAFPYDSGLLLNVIQRLEAAGAREQALTLVDIGQVGTCAPSALAAFARWKLVLRGEPAPELPPEERVPERLSGSAGTRPAEGAGGEGKDFVVPGLKLEMVHVSPGVFSMGGDPQGVLFADDQSPITRVTIGQGFWMGKYEVTQAQWSAMVGTRLVDQRDMECPHLPLNGEGADKPIYHVSWNEAVRFCELLTAAERRAGRIGGDQEYNLPTEAQWEYAARAGSVGEAYASLPEAGWLAEPPNPHWPIPRNSATGVPTVHEVGRKKTNAWGIYDVYGNVSEWCRDWYASALPGGNVADPPGPPRGAYRVVRGGSCWGVENGIPVAGSAVRGYDLPGARFAHGFRVVLIRSEAESR